MSNIAVVIYGPPGSGKTIQADLLARALNLIHFDIGPFLAEILYDPRSHRNRFMQVQRKIFEEGGLCDSQWVTRLASRRIRQIARAGFGVVLSGSLRTVSEAFGASAKEKGLLGVLESCYGRRNIIFFESRVRAETWIRRNSRRFICTVCGRPVLNVFFRLSRCPLCGGKLTRRVLDSPAIIKARLTEYQEFTKPVYKKLSTHGYRMRRVASEAVPFIIHARMLSIITRWRS